jgi:hypothetical protein
MPDDRKLAGPALMHAVALARAALKERGLSDSEIEAELNRTARKDADD